MQKLTRFPFATGRHWLYMSTIGQFFALLCFAWSIIILKIAFLPFMCLKAIHYILKGLVKIQAAHFTILLLGEKRKLPILTYYRLN